MKKGSSLEKGALPGAVRKTVHERGESLENLLKTKAATRGGGSHRQEKIAMPGLQESGRHANWVGIKKG